jgi:hypothetical protein
MEPAGAESLSGSGTQEGERAIFAVLEMGRVTGDPGRDVPAAVREKAAEALRALGASEMDVRPLLEPVPAARPEQRLLYGDSVPAGLKLIEVPT